MANNLSDYRVAGTPDPEISADHGLTVVGSGNPLDPRVANAGSVVWGGGHILQSVRRGRAFSQLGLAVASGVGCSTITALEASRTRYPRVQTLEALWKALAAPEPRQAAQIDADTGVREYTAFCHWLAGFIDGEGCFDIRPQFCRMTLRVRADERLTLEEIVETTGIGFVSQGRNRRSAMAPQVDWVVATKVDCVALVALLDDHPLRAKKRRDYAIWREAVRLWASRVRYPHGWRGLLPFRRDLQSVRTYKEASACPTI